MQQAEEGPEGEENLSDSVDVGNGLMVARGLLSQLAQQSAADAAEHPDEYDEHDYVDIAGYKLPRVLVNQLYAAVTGDDDGEDDAEEEEGEWDEAAAPENETDERKGDTKEGSGSSSDSSIVISDDDDDRPSFASGCTAVAILIDRTNHTVYVANCGDSRIVLSRDGTAVPLSEDHKPEDAVEVKRIEHAGGHVTEEGRINGCLNLSRALGDLRYKTNVSLREDEQIISGCPDVVKCVLNPLKDDYLILMCDGITGSLENQEVVDEVRSLINDRQLEVLSLSQSGSSGNEIEKGGDAVTMATALNAPVPPIDGALMSKVCGDVCDYCVAGDIDDSEDGSGCDNETFMVVRLTDMFSEAQKKAVGSESTAIDELYDPVVVELPALTSLKRKAAAATNSEGAEESTTVDADEQPSTKKRKLN